MALLELEREHRLTASSLEILQEPEAIALGAAPGSGGKGLTSPGPKRSAFNGVIGELHLLICTEDPKYSAQRSTVATSVKSLVTLFSSYVSVHYGIESGAASGVAASALGVPLKIGREAFCQMLSGVQSRAVESGTTLALARVAGTTSLVNSAESDLQLLGVEALRPEVVDEREVLRSAALSSSFAYVAYSALWKLADRGISDDLLVQRVAGFLRSEDDYDRGLGVSLCERDNGWAWTLIADLVGISKNEGRVGKRAGELVEELRTG